MAAHQSHFLLDHLDAVARVVDAELIFWAATTVGSSFSSANKVQMDPCRNGRQKGRERVWTAATIGWRGWECAGFVAEPVRMWSNVRVQVGFWMGRSFRSPTWRM